MSKVTSKYQVSIPKALAAKLGIRVGDELQWEETGGILRARPARTRGAQRPSVEERLRLFDAASARQRARERQMKLPVASERGWTRGELYER